ncbi:MAG: hypothetical protein AAF468_05795 [Pseudomonadota bacterium]
MTRTDLPTCGDQHVIKPGSSLLRRSMRLMRRWHVTTKLVSALLALGFALIISPADAGQWYTHNNVPREFCKRGATLGTLEVRRRWRNGLCYGYFADSKREYKKLRKKLKANRRKAQIKRNRKCRRKTGRRDVYYSRSARRCMPKTYIQTLKARRQKAKNKVASLCPNNFIINSDGQWACIKISKPTRKKRSSTSKRRTKRSAQRTQRRVQKSTRGTPSFSDLNRGAGGNAPVNGRCPGTGSLPILGLCPTQ